MGKYYRPTVLNIPDEPVVILAAAYFKKPDVRPRETPQPPTTTYSAQTICTIPMYPIGKKLVLNPENPGDLVRCYTSVSTNCVILMQNNDTDGRKVKLHLTHGKNSGYRTTIQSTYLPPLSYGVAVRDFYLTRNLLIFRWPLLLYDQPIRSIDCQHRTIDRQRRESQFIEATFPSLRQRPEPYPFFVPTLPLDPLWTPPNVPEMADPSERNPEPGTA